MWISTHHELALDLPVLCGQNVCVGAYTETGIDIPLWHLNQQAQRKRAIDTKHNVVVVARRLTIQERHGMSQTCKSHCKLFGEKQAFRKTFPMSVVKKHTPPLLRSNNFWSAITEPLSNKHIAAISGVLPSRETNRSCSTATLSPAESLEEILGRKAWRYAS